MDNVAKSAGISAVPNATTLADDDFESGDHEDQEDEERGKKLFIV